MLRVKAFWDEEAKVWVATSDDLPGLATEADSVEALVEKLKIIIPELLEANHVTEDLAGIPFSLDAHQEQITQA
jgi:predicted RNase H-like HicB family nuclease